MSFWALEQVAGDRAAVIDGASGASITYAGLLDRVANAESILRRFGQRTLGLILAENTVGVDRRVPGLVESRPPCRADGPGAQSELIGRV